MSARFCQQPMVSATTLKFVAVALIWRHFRHRLRGDEIACGGRDLRVRLQNTTTIYQGSE